MAPKADKKPGKKKPAEEKKTAVAEKAPAEKKPKAGKTLPKEGGAVAGDKKKKRVKKSVETYKKYTVKVLMQKMSTGELLDIEPPELKFPFELQKQISSSLQLSNKTESYAAFEVKTTNPKKYCVHPNTGVVLPRSTCDVIVTMQAQKEAPPDMQCKAKFLLQSVVTSNGVTAKDITPEMFSKEAGHVVKECELRMVYVSPPQPPSPVAEGSEDGSSPRASYRDNNENANSSEVTRAFVDTHDKSTELHVFITSAPKADKKPAEKKPAKEKKMDVAEKGPAEKKPNTGKKLAEEGGAVAGDKKKKRVKKRVKTYKIYIFKVLKQKMSTGELLDIEPPELKFPFELQKQISSSLQLSNKTESYVAFEVKTTNPKKYCVCPNTGVVLPRSTCDVIVSMQAQKEAPPDMQCKDKFLLQSIVTSNGVTAKDITPEMFSKEAGHVVEECNLRMVYVSPPQPPSPVAEGSEEGSSPRASYMDNNENANSSEVTRAFVDTHDKSTELHVFITSAPKADKKLAEKKPTKEKKMDVAEKAPAVKKPKAGKKLAKEGDAVAGDKKKRVKMGVKTYKIYIFKVLKQKMSTGELLDIEPPELKFPFELQKQISSSLQLSNRTESYVAFEVKTTNPKKYCVRPNTGVVLPRSTCDVIVTMQAQKEAPPDMQCKDKFLLQSVVTSNGVTAKDIIPEMFSKEAGHVVEECELRMVYVSPPQPPSPVAEGSEEGSSPRASYMVNNENANSSEVTRAFVDTHDKSSELHEGVKKSGIMGFWDPCPGEPNLLHVEYMYGGNRYEVEVDDDEELLIPQEAHRK